MRQSGNSCKYIRSGQGWLNALLFLYALKQTIYFIEVKKNSWEHIQLTILNTKKTKVKNIEIDNQE